MFDHGDGVVVASVCGGIKPDKKDVNEKNDDRIHGSDCYE